MKTSKDGEALILKKGWFSSKRVEAAKKKEEVEKTRSKEAAEAVRVKAVAHDHIHANRRSVVECSFIWMQDEELQRFNELHLAVHTLLKYMQKVDEWVCLEPVKEGDGEKIWDIVRYPLYSTTS